MAKKNFALKFDDFLDYAKELDQINEKYLKKAVNNALVKTKDYLNSESLKAMDTSKFDFNRTGESKEALAKIEAMPIEWDGYTAKVFVGVDIAEAPQALILALKGTPHHAADKNLYNAMKGKGKYRKEVDKIQQEEFFKVMQEALDD